MKEPSPAAIDRLDLLQTFVRIVEAGSLSAAALQLGTTQPTVSRRLQTLERSLGLRLLHRSTHQLKQTEDGQRAYARAKDLLERWQAMQDDLLGAVESPRGQLRVLVPHAFGQDQMIAPLTEYLHRYPQMSVEWLLQDRRPDFLGEAIDCAVQVGSTDDPSVVAVRLAQIPRFVVAAPSLLDGRPRPRSPGELASLPWLALRMFYQDTVTLTHADGSRTERIAIRPRLSTDSLYAIRNAAIAGLGVAIVSSWVVADDLASGRLEMLVPEWQAAPLPITLVYPYARVQPARLLRFLDIMRAAMPAIAARAVAPSPGRRPRA